MNRIRRNRTKSKLKEKKFCAGKYEAIRANLPRMPLVVVSLSPSPAPPLCSRSFSGGCRIEKVTVGPRYVSSVPSGQSLLS